MYWDKGHISADTLRRMGARYQFRENPYCSISSTHRSCTSINLVPIFCALEALIAFILWQYNEGTAVGEICRNAGFSEATYYNWPKKYAGLMPSGMKWLRQLEEENGKLKKIVADLSLDKGML